MEQVDPTTEAKRVYFNYIASSLQQLILSRYNSLTIISSIAFAVGAVVITSSSAVVKNPVLAWLATGLFLLVATISLGRHIYVLRKDLKKIIVELLSSKLLRFS